MAAAVAPVDLVAAETLKRLTPLGFRRSKGRMYVLDLGGDAEGVTALNSASRHLSAGTVEVNPIVGVRQLKIERVVAELRGDQPASPQHVTASSPLGYVMPEASYKAWVIDTKSEREVQEQVADMVAALRDHGLAYMRRLADVTTLCGVLDAVSRHDQPVMYRRPVCWAIAGEPDKARDEVQRSLSNIGERTDVAALQFRGFAERLLQYLAAGAHER